MSCGFLCAVFVEAWRWWSYDDENSELCIYMDGGILVLRMEIMPIIFA